MCCLISVVGNGRLSKNLEIPVMLTPHSGHIDPPWNLVTENG